MYIEWKNQLIDLMFKNEIGLEKESLRVTNQGRLAQSPHPFTEKYIERDFCENQVEIITPPMKGPKEAYEKLKEIHRYVIDTLSKQDEYLWMFSNPPYFENEDEIPVAHFTEELAYKEAYRNYLSKKYGKKKMLFSGIHYNFSFSNELIQESFKQSEYEDIVEYKNELYLALAKRVVEYSWLIVYLTAASPVFDPSYFEDPSNLDKFSSARCSHIGYWNEFDPIIEYDTLLDYTASINKYVLNETFKAPSELYYPVRLKPRGNNDLDNLLNRGINHIELRMLDLNPLDTVGIKEMDIAFIEYLLLYLIHFDQEMEYMPDKQVEALNNMKLAAYYDDSNIDIHGINIKVAAKQLLEDMKSFFIPLNKDVDCINYQIDKIDHPENRYATKIRELYQEDYQTKGLALSKKLAKGGI